VLREARRETKFQVFLTRRFSAVAWAGMILGGAIVGELIFEGVTNTVWNGANRGKFYEDLPSVKEAAKKQ
jgi:hypothetical protein